MLVLGDAQLYLSITPGDCLTEDLRQKNLNFDGTVFLFLMLVKLEVKIVGPTKLRDNLKL